jgi:hypothetical protein
VADQKLIKQFHSVLDRILLIMPTGPGQLAFDLKADEAQITVLANMLRATGVDVKITGESCLKTIIVSWE